MSTLDVERKKKIRRRKRKISAMFFLISLILFPYLTGVLDILLKNRFQIKFENIELSYLDTLRSLQNNKAQLSLFLTIELIILMFLIFYVLEDRSKLAMTEMIQVTDKIAIPRSVGQGQHGTSRFLNTVEKEKLFFNIVYDGKERRIPLGENIGLVIGMHKSSNKEEKISCINDDIHSIIIGATRSGKTRGYILETIWLRGLSKGSMIISDPKGELFLYTAPFLKEHGIEVIDIDFRSPLKGKHYNYLSEIIKEVDSGNISCAIDKTWDLVSVMVGTPKGEPLWTNGESAVIAAAILIVTMEAPEQYRTLSNVYYFLAYMCKESFGNMPLNDYLADLPDEHPAKGVFAVAEISPDKMRGSFFGSALATLRLFTNWNIADMTSQSDFDLKNFGKKPTAVFIIIPDEKTTLYSLASMFVNQAYISLVELANESGGRLPCPVDFLLDEFGNFPSIPSFGSMLSVGAGRGLRFTLVLQDYQQLEKHYKDDFKNIKGNCVVTLYLKTPTQETLKELSERTGTYTVQVHSSSSSTSGKMIMSNNNYSNSANMQSRPLLYPDEISRIERPYALVFYTGYPAAVFYGPDLSEYKANKELGMGDKEHNRKLMVDRESQRKQREEKPISLWGIWKQYIDTTNTEDYTTETKSEKVSFLDL